MAFEDEWAAIVIALDLGEEVVTGTWVLDFLDLPAKSSDYPDQTVRIDTEGNVFLQDKESRH